MLFRSDQEDPKDTLPAMTEKNDEEVDEELHGDQKKLDVNHDGKITGSDLAALRAGHKAEGYEEEGKKEEEDECWDASGKPMVKAESTHDYDADADDEDEDEDEESDEGDEESRRKRASYVDRQCR